jgi:uncharacterized protein (UPF0218 family)
MPKTYILPEKNRPAMQRAWGKPLFGNEAEIGILYKKFLGKGKFKTVVTVGDYCSHHLASDIKIFDKKVQRQTFEQKHECSLTVKNPAGTIQKETWAAVKTALKDKANLCVDGEEDLLVIPTVLLAKPKTLVVYGFPNHGICLLEANLKNKTVFRLALKKYFKTV